MTHEHGSELRPEGDPGLDYRAVFAGLPTGYLVMTPELVIVEANTVYLAMTGRTRDEIVGRPVFEAFPPLPSALQEGGGNPVKESMEVARDTGRAHTMPLTRYDVVDAATGVGRERFWSLIHAPLLDDVGATVLLLQRAEDVTDYVHEMQPDRDDDVRADAGTHLADAGRLADDIPSAGKTGPAHDTLVPDHAAPAGESPSADGTTSVDQTAHDDRGHGDRRSAWQERAEAVEADLYLRIQDLRAAQHAKDLVALRLASLGEVALQLAAAETVEDLERIVVGRGMAVLGADGGAVISRAEDGGWRVTASASLGPRVAARYATLPYDSPLPGCWTARTGRPLMVPTVAAGLATSPEMATVYEDTGHHAWAMLPLLVRGECLGCLAVSWVDEHRITRDEQDLLESLTAQCAQALDRLLALEAERRAASEVARMSETMQRALLTDPPQPAGLQIAVRYSPAAQDAQVGGDWYDAFVVRDGTTALVVGDVSGHDRDAAAAMSQLRNLLRGIAYAVPRTPAGVLTTLDHAVHDLQEGTLATLVLAELEPVEPAGTGHRLTWSDAGHLPPLLTHPDGTVELLDPDPDLMLGVMPDAVRHDHTRVLEPGSTVLLYTDGLVERRDESIDASLRTLARSVGELGAVPLEDLCDAVLGLLPGGIEDDIALLAVRTGVSASPER